MIPAMPRDLKPKKREEHEVEFSRIVAFSDGVFSIAITLLVLELALDSGLKTDSAIWHNLWEQHEKFLAYAISFAVIARFWLVHHQFFSEVKAFNGRLIGLNMLYLAFIVLIPFSSQVLGEYGGTLPAVVVYSVNLAAVILIGQWMRWDARRADLTTTDAETAREDFITSVFIAGVFLLSIVIALFSPSLAPWIWLALFFEGRGHVIERLSRRTS
ncbi:MAG: hypothetical protein BGO11_16085 [Solirubrobacterales bacterium 70-9]|nr:MAG: hypothetical protein BGO11_16085 [Solirubrobacterales bacterium 70-9]